MENPYYMKIANKGLGIGVTFFIDSPGFGGSEIDALRLILFLNQSGIRVRVVLAHNASDLLTTKLISGGVKPDFIQTGNRIKDLPGCFHRFSKQIKFYLGGLCIVWAHHLDSNRWLQLYLALKRCNFLVVERLLPTDYKKATANSKLTRPIKSFIAGRAAINIICAFTREEKYRKFIRSLNTKVIPTTRDVEAINREVKDKRNKVSSKNTTLQIVSIGRLESQKDPQTSIRAIDLIQRTIDVELVFVGGGELLEECKKLSEDLGISDRIRFVGFQKNPLHFLTEADMFLLPSLYEGLPGVLIEAMAAEVPCIASNIPGNNELVIHKETGLLFEPGSYEQLAAAVVQLAENQRETEVMVQKALELVDRKYNTSRENADWLALLGFSNS